MSLTLSFGNDTSNDIPITSPVDLANAVNAAPTVLKFSQAAIALLTQKVSAIPTNTPLTLNYGSGNNSWNVGQFTFGLSGGISGSVAVLAQGDPLMKYTNTFPTTIGTGLATSTNASTEETITVPAGSFYVAVGLDLTLAANGGATVQLGEVGIQGSANTSDTFAVRFCKSVSGDTLFRDALAAAVTGFVLPLHSATYDSLMVGDYLYHRFNATLNVGLGATLGLDKVYFSGQYKADIPAAGAAAITVNTSVKAEVRAGATFNATFKYTGSYEALLWKSDSQTAKLHIYRSTTTDSNFNIGGQVTVIADPSVSLAAGSLQTLAQDVFSGGTGAAVGSMLGGSAQTQVNNWVNDVQKKITGWLSPFQEGKTQLEVAIDNCNSSYLLSNVSFDLQAPSFASAWSKIIGGDFVAALGLPSGGVSIDSGSGLENFHTVETSITFSLFGLFKSEWSNANVANQSILYKGNNTFALVEVIGQRQTSTFNQNGRSVDVYFAAQATSGPGGLSIAEADLHIDLSATNRPSFTRSMAKVLSQLATGPQASQLVKALLASAEQTGSAQTLSLTFAPTAYGRLQAASVDKNSISNESYDQVNYAAFAQACNGFFGSASPANFSVLQPADLSYTVWRNWSIAANDIYPIPPGDVPSRRHPGATGLGSYAFSYLAAQFRNPANWLMINCVLQAASEFMNLCDDLRALAITAASNNTPWVGFVGDLHYIVSQDVPFDFLIPTTSALAGLMGQLGIQPQLSGPVQPVDQINTMTVSVVFS